MPTQTLPTFQLERAQHEITRRTLIGSTLATAALLAACGPDAEPSRGAGREVKGALGTITVPPDPTRVISVGQYRDTDAAIALGVVPIASPDLSDFIPGGMTPWVREALDGRKLELFRADQLPYEKFLGLEPDLILATDRSKLKDEYGKLSRIAPTLSWDHGYNRDDWQTTTRRVGQALGRERQAAKLVDDTEAAIATVRRDNPEFEGLTFTLGPVSAEGSVNTINSPKDSSAVFFSQLGMKLSPKVTALPDAGFPGRAVVSPEKLDLLDADVMMLTYNAPAARRRMEGLDVFKTIPAVRRGAYFPVDLPLALALGFPTALSIRYGLEHVVPQIRRAIRAS